MWYVAKNGNDTTGDGSYSNPYSTIQKAIDIVEAQSSQNNHGVVNVSPGQYVENLTFANGFIAIIGVNGNAQDTQQLTVLIGSVLVNIVTGDDNKFQRQVILANMLITKPTDATACVYDTSSKQHTLFLQNCYLFGKKQLLYQNSSADCVTRMTQLQINQDVVVVSDTSPTLRFSNGAVWMERCDVDTKDDGPCMLVDGTAIIARCVLCAFEYSFASAGKSLLRIENALLHAIGNCTFVGNVGTMYAIETTSLGGAGTGLNLVQNVFLVSGAGSPARAIQNAGFVYYHSNGSPPGTATGYRNDGIGSNIFPYTSM
jgi:hypothetical protein